MRRLATRLSRHSRPCTRTLRLEHLEARTVFDAGMLDPTFGVGGKVTTDFAPSLDDWAGDVAVQADGKIVVAGGVSLGIIENAYVYRWGVTRYNSDGSLDESFGLSGRVLIDFNGGADDVEVQPDGKIILAGATYQAGSDFAVARLNSDGTLDNTFGSGGTLTIDFGSLTDQALDLALQADGKAVVVGYSYQNAQYDLALARVNGDGTLDDTFGAGGKQLVDFGFWEYAPGVAIQADGMIVVAGDAFIARLTPTGQPDSAFGDEGRAIHDLNGNSVAVQPDGKLVVGGWAYYEATGYEFPVSDMAAVRFNSDGSLDQSFGSAGKQTIDFGSPQDYADGLAIQSDGKIILAGSTYHEAAGHEFLVGDMAVARLNSDGSLDDAFGDAGKQRIDFDSSDNYAAAVALQSDGKIVLAGVTNQEATGYDFAVARLLGDSAVQNVTVDIRPDSLNVDSNGTITVVIFGAADFDAARIDVGSVLFAEAHAWQSTLADANGDGRLDLQLKFRRQDTVLDEIYAQLLVDDHDLDGILDSTRQTAHVEVTGETLEDTYFRGSDDLTLFLSGRSLRNLLDDLFG